MIHAMLHGRFRWIILLWMAGAVGAWAGSAGTPVRAWEEPVVIPAYKVGEPLRDPIFYSGRVYEGAKGPIYPYPLMDKLTDVKANKTYQAIYLENRYLHIMVLPELGGRIFEAVDKTNGYNFIYRQHVIKPALIGMIGAWISGGVEWDIPHHHRASSFLPVDHTITENPDGGKTVWVGETERRDRMKWIVGLTLHPDKSYLEVTVKLFNRTPLARSFLYFANAAVYTNKNYQIIFPPRTQFVTYHSKVAFARWPIADGIYNGEDFRKGVDVSWWKNHPKSDSMFAWNYQDDFFAGYDHGKDAGILHVADHNVVPGKKFFTWGRDGRGRMWYRLLTDKDGPYVELMAGGYSDNQPDYSWVQPYEVKTVKEYWYPFRDIGGVKNANTEAAVNLEVNEGVARFGFCTTAEHASAKITLRAGGRILFVTETPIGPGRPFVHQVALPKGVKPRDLTVSLSVGGKKLIGYTPVVLNKDKPMPEPVEPPLPPKQIKTNEELYLTGLRVEQFYNPKVEPYPYFDEALRRDPGDYRVNTQLGLLYLQRGMYRKAEARLRVAVKRATRNYTRPKDGEAYYYLGVALKAQGKLAEADDAFNRAAWSYAWSAASYDQSAEIACRRGLFATALAYADRSLKTNIDSPSALNLRAVALRRLGRLKEAWQTVSQVRKIDPLNFFAGNEAYRQLIQSGRTAAAEKTLASLTRKMRGEVQNYLELAVDYGHLGLWDDAIAVIDRRLAAYPDKSKVYPMLYYFRGYLAENSGDAKAASNDYRLAAAAPPDYCFPYRMEAIEVLNQAMRSNPRDARAPYYLGNLLYDNQPETALKAWEKSRDLDDSFYLVHRNLGLAYARPGGDLRLAIASLEKSVALKKDPRVLFELDQVYERAGVSAEKRLSVLEANQEVVLQRDDALSREIALLVELGRYDKALKLLASRHFRKWEGVGSVYSYYVDAHLYRGHRSFRVGRYQQALADYRAALEFPRNLEAAKGYRGGSFARTYYFIGQVYRAMEDETRAKQFFENSIGEAEEAFSVRKPGLNNSALILYYKGLSLRELGRAAAAGKIFARLVRIGRENLGTGGVNYYAKFGERGFGKARLARAHYLIGLGYLAQNETARAREEFQKAVSLDGSLLEARWRLR